jgi:signal transduction histidine kinase
VYRILYGLGVLAWAALTYLTITYSQAAGQPILTLRFSSVLAFTWVMTGIALLLLAVLSTLRARSTGGRWVKNFESISTYLNEGVMVVDPKGHVRWHNDTARDLLEGDMNITLNPNIRTLLKRAQTSGRIAIQTLALAEGVRYSVQAMPLDRQTYAIICRPVQAAGTQNSFYENFIRRIVHDMRNPLAAIIGHAANMTQSVQVEPDHWRKSAKTIQDEAQRLARLVDSMLFDARLAYVPLEMQRFDLADVLEEALYAQDERAVREGKSLQMDVPPGPMPIEGDRDLLQRAFENLIDNSLKYSGEDGRLGIRLEDQGGNHVIEFTDNGEGIPPEYLPDRIFEPLVRARSHGSGSGLGLSIVRKIIEMHGGTITAASRVGSGTTMIVRLPKQGQPVAK